MDINEKKFTSDVVAKAAAGALEHLPVVRVGNLNRALDEIKDQGYTVYGVDEDFAGVFNYAGVHGFAQGNQQLEDAGVDVVQISGANVDVSGGC